MVVTWVSPAEAMLLIKLEAPLKNTKNEKTRVAANIAVLFLLRETLLLSSETNDRTANNRQETKSKAKKNITGKPVLV